MTRTKQTRGRSFGGKSPRRQLAHIDGSRTTSVVPINGATLAAPTLDGADENEPPIESPHPSATVYARVDQHAQQTWEEALEAAASEQEQVLRTLFEAAAHRPGANA
ncbi:hypothetical protein K525DRAFT_277958 [Schizophyllum commune Loenen D]|nr:hypothetical protein K525DRAFT_277958 [Schizophyllum commune Loenen D]